MNKDSFEADEIYELIGRLNEFERDRDYGNRYESIEREIQRDIPELQQCEEEDEECICFIQREEN